MTNKGYPVVEFIRAEYHEKTGGVISWYSATKGASSTIVGSIAVKKDGELNSLGYFDSHGHIYQEFLSPVFCAAGIFPVDNWEEYLPKGKDK